MRLTTDGLILKEMNIGESDRLLTILTRQEGLIRAFASGARKFKNKNFSSTSALCYSNLTFFKRKDTYSIDEASPIEVFFSLRNDIVRLSIAQYICELCMNLAPQEDNAEEFLRLALNSLHFLSKNDEQPLRIKAIVELRMLSIAGYMPDLVACKGCAQFQKEEMFFNVEKSGIFCKSCKPQIGKTIKIDKTILASLRHIVYSDFNKLYSFTINDNAAKHLSYITEQYLLSQTDKKFKALEFIKTLDV